MQGNNNQIFYMLSIVRMMATSILCYVVSQKAMTTMVDCNEGTGDCTTQQPIKYLCRIAREQAIIAKAQSARNEIHCNANNIVDMR
jgi:hypothetical protein